MGMCGGGGDDAGAQLRQDEAEKNARIREGTNRINSIFGGDLTKTRSVMRPVTNNVFVPGNGGAMLPGYGNGSSGSRVNMVTMQPFDETYQEAAPGQFGDDFYSNLEKNYTDYYQPQLQRQEADADRSLKLNLARTGNLDSSYGAKQIGRLAEDKATQERALVDNSVQFSNTARAKNEATRANLIGQLENGAGLENVASQAATQAELASAPAAFSPLGDLFKNYTAAVANSAIASNNPGAFPGADQYKNNLLFNIPSSSGGGSSSMVK